MESAPTCPELVGRPAWRQLRAAVHAALRLLRQPRYDGASLATNGTVAVAVNYHPLIESLISTWTVGKSER